MHSSAGDYTAGVTPGKTDLLFVIWQTFLVYSDLFSCLY